MRQSNTFMQDNASIHRSSLTKNWLKDNNIECIDWPANSPDLNPIENVWGILTRAVFANGRQFKNKLDLKKEIMKQWGLISKKDLSNLIQYMPNRIFEVISKNGQNTEIKTIPEKL